MFNLSTRKGSAQQRGYDRALTAKRDGKPVDAKAAAELAGQLYPDPDDHELANACAAAFMKAAATKD